MKLQQFLNKYFIKLDAPTHLACKEGIRLMRKNTDPHHDVNHVYKLLENLDYLLISVPNLTKSIDFSILLPAICWHDVWIATHISNNAFELIYNQIVEGRKSAKMWSDYSFKLMDYQQASKIRYCIRKHSSVQFLPTFTKEAKLLIDLDKLELWNIYRFINKKNTMVSNKKVYSKYIVRMYYQYSWYVGLYFRELELKLKMARDKFFEELK